jgi:hypothetical protein
VYPTKKAARLDIQARNDLGDPGVYARDPSPFGAGAWAADHATVDIAIVGPGPYNRKWYGIATVDQSGRVLKLK